MTATATGVTHMRHIHRAQDVFDAFGIVPNYVIDYPIATQPEAVAPLKAYADTGRALIGAHLHPWVSPPFDEEVNARNSYPGNLPRALEHEKLRVLTGRISAAFGAPPLTYLAGRYGFGPNTGEILESLGYEVDISRSIDRLQRRRGPRLLWLYKRSLLVRTLPAAAGAAGSGGYVGGSAPAGHALYRRLTRPGATHARSRRGRETAADWNASGSRPRTTAYRKCAASRMRCWPTAFGCSCSASIRRR